MPRKDGTGPLGQGARTGRNMGNCAKAAVPIIAGVIAGICYGLGRKNRFGQKNNNRGFRQGLGQGQQQ